jgi:hypothetical protein
MNWRWASASVKGTSHERNGEKLQDFFAICDIGNGWIISVIADGAGSATFGRFGARLACQVLLGRFRNWIEKNPSLPTNEELRTWIDDLRKRLSETACKKETTTRQFAATLAAVIISPSDVITLHIGDCAIVGRNGGEWDVLCWPENGEYINTTYFITDPEPRLNIRRHEPVYDAFALFSDGVAHLSLSYSQGIAFKPFFDPMIRPVDAVSTNGFLHDLSKKLESYLKSPAVCERTDDDKTLILISGR